MKRYLVIKVNFDSRPSMLNIRNNKDWAEEIQAQNHNSQIANIASILAEYGTHDSVGRLKNFQDFGNLPFSISLFDNKFLIQIRDAFTVGAYYPALTGATSFGERILNHLMLQLRDFYKDTPEYKKVYNKESFQDWHLPINTLESWNVLLPDVVKDFKALADIRNHKAVHFNPETDQNDREYALEAIHTLIAIIYNQFGALGIQPWFIPTTKGGFFIKKEAEELPFIKTVYLPNCVLVSPYHKIVEVKLTERGLVPIIEDPVNEDTEITDEEFANIYNK